MNCPSCGKINPDDSRFCMNCGTILSSAAQSAPALPAYQDFLGKHSGDPQFQAIYSKYARSGIYNLKCDILGIEFNINNQNFVDRVWLYPPGTDGGPGYTRPLPKGLAWSDRRADVDRKLGKPEAIINQFSDEYSADYKKLHLLVKFNATSVKDPSAPINYILLYT
jgi:hypothetical protein